MNDFIVPLEEQSVIEGNLSAGLVPSFTEKGGGLAVDRHERRGLIRACEGARRAILGLVALTLGLAAPPMSAAESTADETATPTLAEVAEAFGFSPRDVEKMLSGRPVLGDLKSVSDNELALSAMMMTRRPLAWHVERLEAHRSADPTLTEMRRLEGDGRASLEALTLPDEEIDRLAKARVGDDYNFSAAEVEALQAAAAGQADATKRRAEILEVFRSILADRFVTYRDKGLQSITAYARGGGDVSNPAKQLRRALGELRTTRELAPRVVAAIVEHPRPPDPTVRTEYLWLVNDAEGQILVSLAHRVFGRQDDAAVVIEQRFFIDQTLNGMQAAAVAVPVQEGTAVLYANRTATDLVTGFGSSIAKEIGETLMKREIDRLVDAFLEESNELR